MIVVSHIDPVAIHLGPVNVYWYGLMYMLAFILFVYVGKWRISRYGHSFMTPQLLDNFLVYAVLGVVFGGRVGYCLLYKPLYYLHNPLEILYTWNGGMSFHGGMLGVFIAMFIFTKFHKRNFFELSDFAAPVVPIGIILGRIGNFINGELWGRVTNVPWAVAYPQSGDMLPRHPSQIYEMLGEGVLFIVILWIYTNSPRKLGQTSGVFMMGYAVIRFVMEYFRQPDNFLEFIPDAIGITMGQIYSIPVLIAGIVIYVLATYNKIKPAI